MAKSTKPTGPPSPAAGSGDINTPTTADRAGSTQVSRRESKDEVHLSVCGVGHGSFIGSTAVRASVVIVALIALAVVATRQFGKKGAIDKPDAPVHGDQTGGNKAAGDIAGGSKVGGDQVGRDKITNSSTTTNSSKIEGNSAPVLTGQQSNTGITINGSVGGNATVLAGNFRDVTVGFSKQEIEQAVERYRVELSRADAESANLTGQIAARRTIIDRFVSEISSHSYLDRTGLQSTAERTRQNLDEAQSKLPYKLPGNDAKSVERSARSIADLLYAHSAYEDALSSYRLVTMIDPADAAAWNSLGLCYREIGRFAESIKAFLNAIELGNGSDQAYEYMSNLATVYQRLDLLERAHAVLGRVAEHFEKKGDRDAVAKVYGNLATVEAALGDFSSAATTFEKVLAIETERNDLEGLNSTYFNLAQLYLGSGDTAKAEKATESFEESLEGLGKRDERNGDVLVLRGQLKEKEGKNGEAAKLLESAAEFFESHNRLFHAALTYRNAGDMYGRTGDRQHEKDCLQRGLSLAKTIGNEELTATIIKLMESQAAR